MHAKRFPLIVSAVAALLVGCGAKDAQPEDDLDVRIGDAGFGEFF